MTINRRDFLAVVGGVAAGYGLSQVPLRRLVRMDDCPTYESGPGIEQWIRTSCQLCPGACGMEVRLVDGHPVGVRGNPLHPISRGGLCPVGAEAMHVLYSPDRIKAPLLRSGGGRGNGEWKKAGWDEALSFLTGRIRHLREQGQSDRIYVLDGLDRGLLSNLARKFLAELGSKSYFVDRAPNAVDAAMYLAQGVHRLPAYDLDQARTTLSFGVPLLEGWHSPVQAQQAVSGIRGSRTERDHRQLIQLDVRFSRTAHRADRFVRVKPGSYGGVALAIAYVLIRRGLYDQDFVEEHTFGFEDWVDENGQQHEGFKTFVLRQGRPQDLEEVTGVPTRTIAEIARAFGELRPAVAIADGAATAVSNGVPTALAIHALNALVGSVGRPGGCLFADPVPFLTWPSPSTTDSSQLSRRATNGHPFGLRDAEALRHRVATSGEKVGILFLLHANPLFSTPRAERFEDVLDDDSLVVSFSPFPDESSKYADVLLPDHTFLERWQDAVGPISFPNAVVGITRPVTEPMFDTRHTGDVLLQLARTATTKGEEVFPWKSFEEFLKHSAGGLFAAKRGSAFTSETRATEIAEMERRGWWIPEHQDFGALWDEMLATGGWWDPAYQHGLWGRVLRTPSRRFEFFSRRMYELVHDGNPQAQEVTERLRALGILAGGDAAFLPHYEPPRWSGESSRDSMLLHLVRPIVPNTAVMASLPWVRELMSSRVAWETWLEIHPEDADQLELEDGDLVRVSVGRRSFVARALLTTSVQPGLVSAPYGLGRKAGGRWARTRGTNPNVVIVPEFDKIAGTTQGQGTKVRISPAEKGVLHA
ncbi:MAG: molybdopterin-containing oxidoreductase family protein [Planctomycetota bacterium]|jgi:anaerobic selenocysteine-containing dehydrogenase